LRDRVLVALLTIPFSVALVWIGRLLTGRLGLIGVGILIVSLPIGPALAVLLVRRLIRGNGVHLSVRGAVLGVLGMVFAGLTAAAFVPIGVVTDRSWMWIFGLLVTLGALVGSGLQSGSA
jgi:hypothetical protein